MMTPEIRIRTWLRGTADDERRGLLGYLSVSYGDFILDGLTLRKTAEGRLTLSFPARISRTGSRHPYIAPINERARHEIEQQILKEWDGESMEDAS